MNEEIMNGLEGMPEASFLRCSLTYFEAMKESPMGWQLCVDAITSRVYISRDHAQFFCLQVIEAYVKTRYKSDSIENQQKLRDLIRIWPTLQSQADSVLIRNKIAQVSALLFLQDYSVRCNEFFDELIGSLGLGDRNQTADFFLRFLIALDSEIGDRDICRSASEIQRNNNIKDAMRENVVLKLVAVWLEILVAFENISDEIIGLCHQVIGAYILWIDIGLIANDAFVSHLVKALTRPIVQESSADCIYGIISKGMEPLAKVKLVESFSTFLSSVGIWQAAFSASTDVDYLVKLGTLLNGMGVELIASYNKVWKAAGSKPNETTHQIREAVDAKFVLLLQFLSNEDDDVSASVLDFLRDYLHLLKGKAVFSELEMARLAEIVKVVSAKIRYDNEYNFEDEGEEEISFKEFRKQLRIVFDNVMLVNKSLVIEQLSNIIREVFRNWRQLPWQDVEAALYLLNLMGESLPSSISLISSDPEKYSPVQRLLLEMTASEVNLNINTVVTIQYFEVAVRYDKFYLQHSECIGQVLTTFLETSGFRHPDCRVRSRSAYLFCRFIKAIRTQITPQSTKTLLDAVVDLVAINREPQGQQSEALCSYDEQLYLYEVIGVVIIAGEPRQEQRFNYMGQFMRPLLECYQSAASLMGTTMNIRWKQSTSRTLAHCIACVGRITKAFSPQDTMKSCGCTGMFLEALETFVKPIELTDDAIRAEMMSAVRQYFHRLVVCLDSEILPVIPIVSQVLLRDTSTKSIQEYFPLITQIISKFRKAIIPFLKEMFPIFNQIVLMELAIPLEDNDETGKRDRQFLRRQYFQFLACVFLNELHEVFPSTTDPPLMAKIFESICEGAVNCSDPVGQKTCFSIFKKCIDLYGEMSTTNDTFKNFMYTQIVPACFSVPANGNFDMNDAQAILVVNEIASCIKTMFDKRGEELIEILQKNYLLPPKFSLETSTAYIRALRGSLKEFKAFIKTLFTARS